MWGLVASKASPSAQTTASAQTAGSRPRPNNPLSAASIAKEVGVSRVLAEVLPEDKANEVKRLKDLQGDIHQSFQSLVRERRGKRLKAREKELFSGAFWIGTRALEMGLIDGIGDMRSVMRAKFGDRVKLKPVARRQPFLRRRFGFAGPIGGSPEPGDWAAAAIAAIEERLIWNRFGL